MRTGLDMSDQWAIDETGTNYVDFVWQAVTTTACFKTFRRHPHYTPILEHVDEAQGERLLAMIKDPIIRDICLGSEYSDTVGSPHVYKYADRLISPTTLRYGKVLQDLVDAFPDLRRLDSIVEIGVGYGGQARLISEYIRTIGGNIRRYLLIDLLPVLHLARRYLEHFSLVFEVKYMTKSEISLYGSYDLTLSNYAFSEFEESLQKQYSDLILRRSRSGFLIMNTGLSGNASFAGGPKRNSYSAQELMDALPNCVVMAEAPKTGSENYVLVFGQHAVRQSSTLEGIREGASSPL